MSSLSDKILSFSPVQFVRFNTSVLSNPSNLGSGGTGLLTVGNEAPVLVSTGGPDTEGTWRINIGNGTRDNTTTRMRYTGDADALATEFTDNDFSAGIWFKTNFTLTDGLNHDFGFEVWNMGDNSRNILFFMWGSDSTNAHKGKIRIGFGNGSTFVPGASQQRVDDQQWHYFAVRSYVNGSTLYRDVYIDGQLYASDVATNGTSTYDAQMTMGDLATTNSSHNGGFDLTTWEFSNYHAGPSSFLTEQKILEIYGTVYPVNTSFNALPATASCEIVNPTLSLEFGIDQIAAPFTANANLPEQTIVIADRENVEITTSITASAEFLNPSVFGATNVNNVAEPMTASAEFLIHTSSAGTGVNVFADILTSSAEILEPPFAGGGDRVLILEVIATATAEIIEASVTLTPNYRNLVKRNNPSFYLNDPDNNGASYFVTPVNDGYENWGTGAGTVNEATAATSPGVMLGIGNGQSVYGFGNYTSTSDWGFTDSNADLRSRYVHTPGNDFSLEFWIYSPSNVLVTTLFDFGSTFLFGYDYLEPIYSGPDNQFPIVGYERRYGLNFTMNGDTLHEHDYTAYNSGDFGTPTDVFIPNTWNHFVINAAYGDYGNGDNLQTTIWRNGEILSVHTGNYTNADPVGIGESAGISGWNQDENYKFYTNQIALYKNTLSNSEIVTHYDFITSLSPNRFIEVFPMEANAFGIDSSVFTVVNKTFPSDTVTASAEIANPVVGVTVDDIYNAEVMLATSQIQVPFFFGDPDATINAEPGIVYADMPQNVYRIDTAYYQYVQTNLLPYRYATFDLPNTNSDFGSDNDYVNAAPFVYGGTITQAVDGINNNSLLTDGLDYTTSGLIMKESEYNDDWGTDGQSYHASFWIRRSPEDQVPNGVRILLVGYGQYNGAYGILYQYNNTLYFEIFDGTNRATFASDVSVNVFDYSTHHIVASFDHNGVNNSVTVYVDKQDVLTIDYGQDKIVFINDVNYLEPNTEANNFPRFSVGALIAPFANTSLPTVPTPTKMYIDDVHWSLESLDQTGVDSLYAAMPYSINIDWAADVFLSLNSFVVEPSISLGAGVLGDAVTASADIVEPAVTVDYGVDINADIIEASADIVEPFSIIADNITNIDIVSDVFVASATMPGGGAIISVQGNTMYATAVAVNIDRFVDQYLLLVARQSRLPLETSFKHRWGGGDIDS